MIKDLFSIPEDKKIRVIVDTDAACEADDPYAIVHALLSPKLIVKGIVAEHFAEISEAVAFIIEEALKNDDKPLYILCQGAITNVAAAIRECPEIKKNIPVIWIGTHGTAPNKAPFREFNAGNDVEAANFVLESGINLWLVPSYVYITINIGIAEIKRRISHCGKIGEHLYTNLMDYNHSEMAGWTKGESWSLGDSPAPAIAMNPDCGRYEYVPAPHVEDDTSSSECPTNPIVRIYKDVDSRYILEDFIAKLELFTGAE